MGGGGEGGAWPLLISVAKIKKGNKAKDERVSKHKLLKGFNQDQNVAALVMFNNKTLRLNN